MSEISKIRSPDEAALVEFDKRLHPGLVYRGLLVGSTLAQIADMIGVPQARLEGWLKDEPDMAEAALKARDVTGEIAAALVDAAKGYVDPETGIRKGVSVSAAQYLMKVFGGEVWNPEAKGKNSQGPVEEDEIEKLAESVRERVEHSKSRVVEFMDITAGEIESGDGPGGED